MVVSRPEIRRGRKCSPTTTDKTDLIISASAPSSSALASESRRSDRSAPASQYRSHIAVGFHRLDQPQSLASARRSSVADQRPPKPIPHLIILPHETAQPIQRFQRRPGSYRSARHTSALRAHSIRRAPASAHPPESSARPSCSCCAPRTAATAGMRWSFSEPCASCVKTVSYLYSPDSIRRLRHRTDPGNRGRFDRRRGLEYFVVAALATIEGRFATQL